MDWAAKGGDDVSRGRSHTHKLSCQHSCKFSRRCQLLLRDANVHSSLPKFGSMVVRFSALISPTTNLLKIPPAHKISTFILHFPSPSRPILVKSSSELLHIAPAAPASDHVECAHRLITLSAPSFAHMRKKLALQRGCSCGATQAPCAHRAHTLLLPLFEEARSHYQDCLHKTTR